MKLSMHPQDVQWLRRQLRINFRCVICIVMLSLFIRYQPTVPILSSQASSPAAATLADHHGDIDSAEFAPLPREAETEPSTTRRPNPVAPTGWRRTSKGWEKVSTWPNQKSISELVVHQQSSEPAWIRFLFAKLRGVPPLMVALLQITGVAVIIGIAHDRRKNA